MPFERQIGGYLFLSYYLGIGTGGGGTGGAGGRGLRFFREVLITVSVSLATVAGEADITRNMSNTQYKSLLKSCSTARTLCSKGPLYLL